MINFVYFYYDDFKIDYCFEYKYEDIYFNLILKSSKICLLLIKTLINKLITVIKVRRFKWHLKQKQKVMHIIKVI